LIDDACRAAGVSPGQIDHINAHGTATLQNDRAEARGFQRVFGDRAATIPVTSLKAMVGHCLAAAGAVEAAALALTISSGIIPPTINFRESDPDCPLDVVANDARERPVTCGVSTSLAFGGNDAAVVMGKV
jgi:3-oxoacyl-[acyl-carrier-protein] synthase II